MPKGIYKHKPRPQSFCENQKKKMKEKWNDPAWREKQLEILRSEETRQLHKEGTAALWEDPDYRDRQSDSHKKYFENEENRDKHSHIMMEVMRRPDFIETKRQMYESSEWRTAQAKGQTRPKTKPEQRLLTLIEEVAPNLFILYGGRKFKIGRRYPDFVYEDRKLLIEYFGERWHSEEMTGENRADHEQERINYFAEYGWRTLVIWGNDLDSDPERVQQRIFGFVEMDNVD